MSVGENDERRSWRRLHCRPLSRQAQVGHARDLSKFAFRLGIGIRTCKGGNCADLQAPRAFIVSDGGLSVIWRVRIVGFGHP